MGYSFKINNEFIQWNYHVNYEKTLEIISREDVRVPHRQQVEWAYMFSKWEIENVFGLENGWEEWRETVYWMDWDEVMERFLFEMLLQKFSYKAQTPDYGEESTDIFNGIVLPRIMQFQSRGRRERVYENVIKEMDKTNI
ncbi:MAG: hypothetical protein PUF62_09655 [Bacteroidales bacterium]|nr:hypothetical protein [Bacteroidales bacterium]